MRIDTHFDLTTIVVLRSVQVLLAEYLIAAITISRL